MLFPTVLIAAVLHCAGTYDPRCPLFGDVDGDGRADTVWIERMPHCRSDLVVRTRTRVLRANVPKPLCAEKPSDAASLELPRVVALRPMTARKGFEPEVLTWAGASNYGVRFFTLLRGRLKPLGGEWNLGGYAQAYSLTDCIAPQIIRRAQRWYDGRRWHALTQTYRVTETAFIRVSVRDVFVPMRSDDFMRCHGVARVPQL